jgi:hypothetical protein
MKAYCGKFRNRHKQRPWETLAQKRERAEIEKILLAKQKKVAKDRIATAALGHRGRWSLQGVPFPERLPWLHIIHEAGVAVASSFGISGVGDCHDNLHMGRFAISFLRRLAESLAQFGPRRIWAAARFYHPATWLMTSQNRARG